MFISFHVHCVTVAFCGHFHPLKLWSPPQLSYGQAMTRTQNDLNTTSPFSGRDVRKRLKDSRLALAQMEGASNQSWAQGNGRFASLF
jgi:hypothetical protein